jgi:thiol-disulfide isomerase/thioredoxin
MSRFPLGSTAAVLAAAALAVGAAAVLSRSGPARADDVAGEAPAAEAPERELEWVGDFDRAVELAKERKKDLLVDFTGSDWCSWCMRLHEEVFSKPEFRATDRDFVLVSLDFPQSPEALSRVPNPARNRELAEKYGIEGYPTVLLLTPEGDVYGRTGYRPGGAADYVAFLTELRTTGRAALVEAIALAMEFDGAAAEARPAVAEKVLAKLDGADADAPWTAKLLPVARASIELDADGSRGFRVRALMAIVGSGDTAAETLELARKADAKNEKGLLERASMALLRKVQDDASCRTFCDWTASVMDQGFRDPKLAQLVLANAASWSKHNLGDDERAKAFALQLRTVAEPDNAKISKLLESILGKEEAKGAEPDAPGGGAAK